MKKDKKEAVKLCYDTYIAEQYKKLQARIAKETDIFTGMPATQENLEKAVGFFNLADLVLSWMENCLIKTSFTKEDPTLKFKFEEGDSFHEWMQTLFDAPLGFAVTHTIINSEKGEKFIVDYNDVMKVDVKKKESK